MEVADRVRSYHRSLYGYACMVMHAVDMHAVDKNDNENVNVNEKTVYILYYSCTYIHSYIQTYIHVEKEIFVESCNRPSVYV